MPLRRFDPHQNDSRYEPFGSFFNWYSPNGDPRLVLPLALVMIIAAALSAGLVHLSREAKAKRLAAEALPASILLIDEQGQRTVLSLDAPAPQPAWAEAPQPTASDFPIPALEAGVSGEATVSCEFIPTGDVVNCQVVEEIPLGYGFGTAAVQIVSRGKLTQETVANSVGSFTVRVPFNLD